MVFRIKGPDNRGKYEVILMPDRHSYYGEGFSREEAINACRLAALNALERAANDERFQITDDDVNRTDPFADIASDLTDDQGSFELTREIYAERDRQFREGFGSD